MPRFSLSKAESIRSARSQNEKNQSRSEMSARPALKKEELLVFVVDDDPHFLQIINTHFSKLELQTDNDYSFKFQVRNYATGNSCLKNLHLNPDLILLNYYISKGLPNALSGKDTLDQINEINPNQKVIILNDMETDLREAFIENGLRDYIIQDNDALMELNRMMIDILNR